MPAYSAKEDTSVAGTFEEYGVIQHQGQRNDIISLKRSIEDSSSWRSVLLNEAHAHTTAKYLKYAKEVFHASRRLPAFSLDTFYAWQI